ncbi:MAG: hypothetical protein JWP33_1677 [Blastococcus sp.]|jgi:hypothetical protein|nr:hypothetical protein [Blastococcus sp.]
MSTGPFLYDDDPAPLHTGTPRRRPWLLMAIFGGTIALGVLMVLLMPLIKGAPEEQVREVAGVFVAALEKDDLETAYGLLCEDERARVAAADLADEYGLAGSGTVGSAQEIEVDGAPRYLVQVRWSGGGSSELAVVNEDGASICGVTAGS